MVPYRLSNAEMIMTKLRWKKKERLRLLHSAAVLLRWQHSKEPPYLIYIYICQWQLPASGGCTVHHKQNLPSLELAIRTYCLNKSDITTNMQLLQKINYHLSISKKKKTHNVTCWTLMDSDIQYILFFFLLINSARFLLVSTQWLNHMLRAEELNTPRV